MPISWIALLLAAGVTAHALLAQDSRQVLMDGRDRPLADNMLLWHQAAVAWRSNNSGFAGSVPSGALQLPSWYAPMTRWRSLASSSGDVATYATLEDGLVPGRLAAALATRTLNAVNAGIARGDVVISPGRNSGARVPAGAPDGAVMIVTSTLP